MKIRIIKKLVKSQRLKTDKQKRLFLESIRHSASIRNTVARGILKKDGKDALLNFFLEFEPVKSNLWLPMGLRKDYRFIIRKAKRLGEKQSVKS